MTDLSTQVPAMAVTRIHAEPDSFFSQLREAWARRALLYFLAWRDLKARYRQTVLGMAWFVLQPLCQMAVFTFIFGHVARLPSNGLPYPLFVLPALVLWQFFMTVSTQAGSSLMANSHILAKVYFPRLLIPLAATLSAVVDLALASLLLIGCLALYHVPLSWMMLMTPAYMLLAFITAFGAGLWICAMGTWFRDVHHAVPAFLQVWFYATPIVYPSTALSTAWQHVVAVNPMAGAVEGFRWALTGGPPPGQFHLAIPLIVAVGLVVSGMAAFNRFGSRIADVL